MPLVFLVSAFVLAVGYMDMLPFDYRLDTDGEVFKCSMDENNAIKTMVFQKIFVTLQNPRKNSGSHFLLSAFQG